MISVDPKLNHPAVAFLNTNDGLKLVGKTAVEKQTDEDVIEFMPQVARIRYAGPRRVPTVILNEAAKTGTYIARAPVLMEGRLELLHFYINQSICDAYHRYGNLGERSTI